MAICLAKLQGFFFLIIYKVFKKWSIDWMLGSPNPSSIVEGSLIIVMYCTLYYIV